MKLTWKKHTLTFKRPSGTSRGVLHQKDSWLLIAHQDEFPYPAIGECSIIAGLSPDSTKLIETKLTELVSNEHRLNEVDVSGFPAVQFGLEILQKDIEASGSKVFYKNDFTAGNDGILINGLIWMGDPRFMQAQIAEKLDEGHDCLKLKIGALDFQQELEILTEIRKNFNPQNLELRVDANGAFDPSDALEKLKILSDFEIHSIEQPIAPKQWGDMAALCSASPIDIALDEELIGLTALEDKKRALDTIKPQYIILKPSLLGGLKTSDAWIDEAEQRGIKWWLTSALESNIGLNAIAQYAYDKGVSMPQGLGTGSLYTNNIDSPLYIQRQFLRMHHNKNWNLKPLNL